MATHSYGIIPPPENDLSILSLSALYRNGTQVQYIVEHVWAAIEAYHDHADSAVWIHRESKESIMRTALDLHTKFTELEKLPPLFGVPFTVKDNIDVAGLPTTTGCRPLTRYPTKSSPIFTKLIEQGALFVGKTNLEQLATGMTGCRSPYGTIHSVYHKDYITGGSSGGSCVTVGARLVTFSIGSDTAGSGRVPAAFNGVIGWKPSLGTVSAVGITPACQSLDCVAIITRHVQDARTVWNMIKGYDEDDIYARALPSLAPLDFSPGSPFFFGVPPSSALQVCAPPYRRMFEETIKHVQNAGGKLREIDWTPFEMGGKLLYEGTFVSERLAGLPDTWLEIHAQDLHPVTRKIFEGAANRKSSSIETFRDLHMQKQYTRQAEKILSRTDGKPFVLLVPTVPTHFTIAEVEANPIATNSALGDFAHFANVLDLCAIAIPAGTFSVTQLGGRVWDAAWTVENIGKTNGQLPFGVTLLASRGEDEVLLDLASSLQATLVDSTGISDYPD